MEELKLSMYEALMQAKEDLSVLHKEIEGKHVVIFLGSTRSGKSTIINYILETELHSYELRKNVYKIKKADEEAYGPHIGQGTLSKTAFLGLYDFNGFLFIDAPGFDDNRGEVQAIINAISINQIRHAQTCRFVLVSDINDIVNDNVGSFLKFIAKVNELIPSIDILKNSVSLMLTKDNNNYSQHEIAAIIREQIINKDDLKISEKDRELLIRFGVNENTIAFFRMPTDQGKVTNDIDVNIQGALKNNAAAYIGGYQVGFVVSSEVRLTLSNIYEEVVHTLEFNTEINQVLAEHEQFLNECYLTSSTGEELLKAKTDVTRLVSTLIEYENNCLALQDILNSLKDLAPIDTSGDLYTTLTLLTMLDEVALMNSHYKDIIIDKYREALQQMRLKIDKLKVKILSEERKREDINRKNGIIEIVSTSAIVVGTAAACVGESALTTGVVALASTGIGAGLVIGGLISGLALKYVKKKYLEAKNRTRQRQGRPSL